MIKVQQREICKVSQNSRIHQIIRLADIKNYKTGCLINQNHLLTQKINQQFIQITRMNVLFHLLALFWVLLLPLIKSYSLLVQVDNKLINFVTVYTFTFDAFVNNNTKNVNLTFPPTSNITQASVIINKNGISLSNTLYTVDPLARTIYIPNLNLNLNTLIIQVSNVVNPPYADQFFFNTSVTSQPNPNPSPILPLVNYDSGTLLSCNWNFHNFTGSTNSIVDIEVKLGNKLLPGNSNFQINFPFPYEEGTKHLTMTTPTLSFSIDNGLTYNTNNISGVVINNNNIKFSVSLLSGLNALSFLQIRLAGIVNPPTQNPSGTNFIFSTFDSNNKAIDTIPQCNINPLNVMEFNGFFDQTSLNVNDSYKVPLITVNTTIPFTISKDDIMQINYNEAMPIIAPKSNPWITIARGGSPVISFNPSNQSLTNTTTRFFIGDKNNINQASNTTLIQLYFDIRAPYSQRPWQFVVTLSKKSGAYMRIRANLKAYAIFINQTKVTINATDTRQMAKFSQYRLNVTLQKAISKNGKLMLGFNDDYVINTGPCVGFNGGSKITATSTCNYISRNGSKWLAYKIGSLQDYTNILDIGTTLMIQFQSPSIKNPLYLKTYTYRLQVYFTESDDSLVAKALIFGNIAMTTHFSLKAFIPNPDFRVYDYTQLDINYTNTVYIPENSNLEFILPPGMISFAFINNIFIGSSPVTNATLATLNNGLTGRVTVKQNIPPQTIWIIPLMVKTPIICNDYPSITLKVMNSSEIYQEVSTGLGINVRLPSTELVAKIQPKTNNTVEAETDYTISIDSGVPLDTKFYVIVTLPIEVTLKAVQNCMAFNGTCSKISTTGSPNVLNLTLENSPYTKSNNIQKFIFVVSSFINPRYVADTSNWKIQLKGIFNNTVRDISETLTKSSNFTIGNKTVCRLDPKQNYYRSNIEPVLIQCDFVNQLIQGDIITFEIVQSAYSRKANLTFNSNISISCKDVSNPNPTINIEVNITANLTFNKKNFNLYITGLISNPSTTYSSISVPLYVRRFNSARKPIDQGIFYYDISCNENSTIIQKQCKTCFSDRCDSCYSSMYLSANGFCVKDCPSETEFRSLNSPNSVVCQPCTPPCYTCVNTSTTCQSCTSSQLYFLNRSSHVCQTKCNTTELFWVNTVDIPGTRICEDCLEDCKRCVNNTLVGCLECQNGYNLEGGTCRKGCLDPNKYPINGICVLCNFACDTCYGPGANNCYQCRELYYLNNGFCVSTCPSNKYPLSNGTCGCQSNCATCTSSSPTFCMSCLNTLNLLYNGTCLTSCPLYTIMSSSQCLDCPKNCIKCLNTVTCQQCGPGFLKYQSACYGDCNSISFQFDKKSNTCVLCPTGCDTCNDNICTSCLLGYVKKEDQCMRECLLTNSCDKGSDSITPVPATIAFVVWVGIVYVAKFFNPKIYPAYSIVFLTSALEYFLIIGTTISCSNMVSESVKRLLEYDQSQRPIIMNLLIVVLVVNYVMNIIFAIIFFKYLMPLIHAPRQVDYITIGAAFIIGMITNYRFCLIFFSKMFPKPRINVEFSSRLTPVHYLCIASVFLSGFALAASGIILKNQYPLTDIFMLAIDIIIIEVILILFSIWMVAVDKSPEYFDDEKKVYHLEDNYKTQENVMQDDKNNTKIHLNIRDQFDQNQHNNTLDDTNTKKLLGAGATTIVNVSSLNLPESENQKPLEKRQNRLDIDKIRMTNKVQNSFDTDISDMNKVAKNKKTTKNQLNESNNQMLKPKEKQNVVEYDKRATKAIFDSKKFQTSDQQNNMPKVIKFQQHAENEIIVDFQEPQSDDIPNLPITNSIFHEKSSSEFGQRIKPKKTSNRNEQKSEVMKKNSPVKSPKKGKDIEYSQAESKSMMKKKSKLYDSQMDNEIPERDTGMDDLDIEKIIKNKIVVIDRKDTKDEKMSIGEANNISSIERREEESSEFNDEVSPSWFNIQNQRFDIQSVNSEFTENN